jgi:hypothetical protein
VALASPKQPEPLQLLFAQALFFAYGHCDIFEANALKSRDAAVAIRASGAIGGEVQLRLSLALLILGQPGQKPVDGQTVHDSDASIFASGTDGR